MQENSSAYTNSGTSKIIFILSLFVSGYWWLGKFMDVYRFDFAGAIYEILWLPVLALLFVLPILSLIWLIKEKFSIRSFYLYSILACVTTILFMVFSK